VLLAADDLTKSFRSGDRTATVLRGVSLRLERGETLALTGESGSGKSTLLHLVGLLDAPDSGEIRLDGDPVTGLSDAARARIRRARIGLVFQHFNLIPSLTAGANIAFQARLARREDPAWTQNLVERLGLGAELEKYPEQLSGGQQQRVAIGRALAVRPDLILADEPTGNLDEAASDRVTALMAALARDSGAGFLMATHSERLAARLDRRLRLSGGVVS